MRNRLSAVLVSALLGTAVGLAGCVPPPPPPIIGTNPYPPVPPPPPEQRPLPPVSENQQVWHPGEWEWTGTGYVWHPGGWEALDGHSNQYLLGHWTRADSGQWLWEPGHWL